MKTLDAVYPNEIKKQAEVKMKLSEIPSNTILYKLAEAKIKYEGYYACIYKDKKTFITS